MNNIDLSKFNFQLDYILVEAIDTTNTVDGLDRPEQYEDKSEFGTVIATGNGRMLDNGEIIPLKINVGDIALFGKYSSEKIRISGKDYLIIRADDVIAIQ